MAQLYTFIALFISFVWAHSSPTPRFTPTHQLFPLVTETHPSSNIYRRYVIFRNLRSRPVGIKDPGVLNKEPSKPDDLAIEEVNNLYQQFLDFAYSSQGPWSLDTNNGIRSFAFQMAQAVTAVKKVAPELVSDEESRLGDYIARSCVPAFPVPFSARCPPPSPEYAQDLPAFDWSLWPSYRDNLVKKYNLLENSVDYRSPYQTIINNANIYLYTAELLFWSWDKWAHEQVDQFMVSHGSSQTYPSSITPTASTREPTIDPPSTDMGRARSTTLTCRHPTPVSPGSSTSTCAAIQNIPTLKESSIGAVVLYLLSLEFLIWL